MKKNILLGESNFFYSTNEKGKYPKQETPEVAFLGRSNTGKSSLINSILNKKKNSKNIKKTW
jgi:GTP-binding protein